ncbi:DUF2239 family protein [Sphingomonas sp. C3-2]|uniref:DUF2239 family protein n=1 Tax=Sphingomonas sp. C3-2 TaxID=3062169 RepID=UPI00294B3A3A|nr:DUF2239 family protein [Sphingomonas sp. C3-2]WOK35728.1 DUF2239 family protein [Sphingomonas sp. C3-2]
MESTCTAFAGELWIATGPAADVREALRVFDDPAAGPVLVFDDRTGRQIDLDMRVDEPARGRGRPKLGVIAGEVTLLPEHWEWLRAQRGGASITLRRLIDEAAKARPLDAARQARDATYHFLTAIAGDRPHFEDAIRALYAGQKDRFDALTADWAVGIRDHATSLAQAAWAAE